MASAETDQSRARRYAGAAGKFAGIANYLLGRLKLGLTVAAPELAELQAQYRAACELVKDREEEPCAKT